MLRRHRLFAAFLLLAVGLRVAVSIAYWPALELNGDSYDYLGLAHSIGPGIWHPAGYPLFLAVLSLMDQLGLVVVVQHLLGIATGVVIYVLALRLTGRRWLAAIAALPVLIDGYQLDIEQFILPETVADLLLIGGLTLVLWRERVGPWQGAASALLLAAATLTRTAFLPVLVVVAVYLLLRAGRWRGMLAFCAVATVILIGYGGWYAATHGYFGYSDDTGHLLYGRVAPFATCDYTLPHKESQLCPALPPSERSHNPEFYTWWRGSPLRATGGLGNHHQRDLLAERFAIDVIEHQPLTYASTVLSDTWHYFTPGRWMTANRVSVLRWRFPPPHIHPNADAYNVTFANEGFNGSITASPDPLLMGPLRTYQSYFYMPGPAFLVWLIAALGVGLGLARPHVGSRPARWAAIVLAASAVLILLSPSLTVGFSYRYGLPLLVLLPPAAASATAVALEAFAARRRHPLTTGAGNA